MAWRQKVLQMALVIVILYLPRERTHKYVFQVVSNISRGYAPTRSSTSPTSPGSRPTPPPTFHRDHFERSAWAKVDQQPCCPTTAPTIRAHGDRCSSRRHSRIRLQSGGGDGPPLTALMCVHVLIVAGRSSVPNTWSVMYGLVSHPTLSHTTLSHTTLSHTTLFYILPLVRVGVKSIDHHVASLY